MQHFFGTAEACKYSEELAQESQKKLDALMAANGINFEGKPLPIQIRPYVYGKALNENCRNLFEYFFRILKKIEQLYRTNIEVQNYFKLESWHHDLVTMKRTIEPFNQLCRFDFMFDGNNNPQIYETNTACPGGLLLTPIIADLAQNTPLYKKLLNEMKDYSWCPHQQRDYFVDVVSETFRLLHNRNPKVALLNSRHNTLTNELGLMEASLTRANIENEVCYVEDLQYMNDGVFSPKKNLRLDVCFQKFDNALSSEGIAHFGATRASVSQYIEVIRKGNVIGINPFGSHYLTEQKSILAFLHDNKMKELFSLDEQKLINQIVPYTVLKSEAADSDFKLKDEWVLKKSLDTRGRNVIMGSEVSQSAWMSSLQVAKSMKEGFVLQRRVPSEVVKEQNQELYVSHAAFLVQGKYVGMFPRFSTEPLTNVGRNGFLGIPILRGN